jgi:hypothetical protein
LAAAGRPDEASDIANRLLALEPAFNLAEYERTLLPFREPALRSLYLEHLRKAGLPP